MEFPFLARRAVLGLAAGGVAAICVAGAGTASAASKDVLVIGTDISDTNFLDPSRQFAYSAPITIRATYETLVTMAAGDYVTIKPLLAESWERTADGTAWVFHLRKDVKFSSGNPLTADDVKFTFERLLNLKDQPADLAENVKAVDVVDPATVKITMNDKNQPLLNVIAAPTFVIMDAKVVKEHGGTSEPGADKNDKASEWLNQNSAGTGPYILSKWESNSEIDLKRNPGYWGGEAGFKRVVIRHIAESATQLLALKRGDIDAALNLTSPQLDSLEGEKKIAIQEGTSLDYIYMTLTSGADLNKALGSKAARQAIAHAIDYDGIIKGLMGGYGVRPATFIPVGLDGSTDALTKEIGYKEDLAQAKKLLADAGVPDGFSFDLSFGNAAVAGTTYALVAQKIQSDLARIGIKANLNPMDQTNMRTKYRAGELASAMTFWNPDAPEPYLWAAASVQRVAKRVRWTVPQEMTDLVTKAGGATDPAEQSKLYRDYQERLVDEANYIILVQPVYRVATRTRIAGWELTAAGWQVDLKDVKPAK